jgi:hypothetical protein
MLIGVLRTFILLNRPRLKDGLPFKQRLLRTGCARRPSSLGYDELFLLLSHTYTILKHQFQRSSHAIFLQITPHIYFKLTTPRPLRATNLHVPKHTSAYRWSNGGPSRARRMRSATLAWARYADLLIVPGRLVRPSGHLVKSA